MVDTFRTFLYGAGGHAKVVADIAEQSNVIISGAIDENNFNHKLLDIYPIYNSFENLNIVETDRFIVAIGNNRLRINSVEDKLPTVEFITLIHPSAIISPYTKILEGTVLMAGVTINVDAHIGKHCIINTNATVDHDCKIGDYVHISPNASLAGSISVGEGSHIGIGAIIIQGIKIGKWCTIGAGAVIIRDVPDGATVVGNPGRIIKFLNK
ncbi:acetyltransferase [Sphingobacterium rhinopitheci]|uniref:acetyltransferase n=1 Tax=Sphingobacterium rhinopitheci TaxID=2781960 RepID=UPI001F51D38B|nr:acetyltransferase [Sphingobacterium rhinopitheci]MCI0920625.1 acetyltransferase [Sphingobacterium rhinopitheci]